MKRHAGYFGRYADLLEVIMKYDMDVFLRKPRKYVKSIIVIAMDDDAAYRLAEAHCNLSAISFSYEIASKEPHPDQYDHIPMPAYRKNLQTA